MHAFDDGRADDTPNRPRDDSTDFDRANPPTDPVRVVPPEPPSTTSPVPLVLLNPPQVDGVHAAEDDGAVSGFNPSALALRWPVRQTVGDLLFVATSPEAAAGDVVAAAHAHSRGEHIHLANAFSVSLAHEYPVLAAQTFSSDGWNLPDGRPISWVSRVRGDVPHLQQIRGPQFFLDVCAAGIGSGLRHFLLGGSPDVLATLEARLRARYPGIRIVGSDSPPFRQSTQEELDDRDALILASQADIVWVGLGTPKQDVEAARLAAGLPVVAVAVGAAFDYAAGTLREAPVALRRLGLEWAFRLAMEPRRLWRRYLFGNVRFLRVAFRARP